MALFAETIDQTKRLIAILEQRSVMRKRRQRGPKLAALEVLARYNDAKAHAGLVAATRDPDPAVCERARGILTASRDAAT